jgi:hypothetical protein
MKFHAYTKVATLATRLLAAGFLFFELGDSAPTLATNSPMRLSRSGQSLTQRLPFSFRQVVHFSRRTLNRSRGSRVQAKPRFAAASRTARSSSS